MKEEILKKSLEKRSQEQEIRKIREINVKINRDRIVLAEDIVARMEKFAELFTKRNIALLHSNGLELKRDFLASEIAQSGDSSKEAEDIMLRGNMIRFIQLKTLPRP
jgi:hypothetical protein